MANTKNLSKRVPFKKNDPRINRKGRPEKLPGLDILLADVLCASTPSGLTVAEKILKVLANKAVKGDVRSAEILLDRAYGKAKQVMEDISKNTVITVTRTPRLNNG
jgi:hypothetical protein